MVMVMKKLITNVFFALLILLIISGIFTLYGTPSEKPKEIPLNELATQINEGKVAKIIVEENDLTIELKDGTKQKSRKEQEASLTQSLINYGVDQEKFKEISLDVKQPSGFLVWAGAMLPFLIPFLFIALFLWFMFRQAQKGQTQAFTFGKSKARMAQPDKKQKITFKDVAGIKEAKEELEEIVDAVGRHRGAGLGGGHDEREQTLNQILTEMDGFDTGTNVIVIAATNRPDILDPALLRPGRFDRRVVLDMPDIKERKAILKIHAKNKKLATNVDLRGLAERTPGFSGADLANLINEGALLAARKNQKTITQQELLESIEKVLLGPQRKSHILSKKEKEIAAYHEAGHALVTASLKHTDPIHKVSIISRGRVAGYTLKLPIEDKYLRTRSEFLDELALLLGGYCAEKLIFNELTTGASNDLLQASELARNLVTRYGMSEKLGPMTFGKSESLVFLGKEITEQRNYSEKIAAEIDEEVKKLICDARKTAEKILKQRRRKLNQIAKKLIEKEVIEKKEFEKLMKQGSKK